MKTVCTIEIQITMDHPKDVDLEEVINDLEYELTSTTAGVSIVNSEMIDYAIFSTTNS